MAGSIDFPIIAPAIAKKGESIKIILGTLPVAGESVQVHVVDPSGRTLPQQIVLDAGTVYPLNYYFRFVPTANGTYSIFAIINTPPTPDIYVGFGSIHVPEWLNNIDAPISDINKQTRENSRLRTTIIKGSGFSS